MKVFSVTQSNQIDLCHRQRWFQRVKRLPDVKKKRFEFGKAIDGVINRYLEADDTGRTGGLPVNLYPEGWDAEISQEEAQIIKTLLEKAISEGVLRKIPGRQVQRHIHRPLINDWVLEGYVDIDNPEGIEDNKSTKDMKYAHNERTLKEDIQLRIYWADRVFQMMEAGIEPPKEYLIRQNYYCKNPEKIKVKYTEAVVTLQEVLATWDKVQKNALIADEIAEVKDWKELPNPPIGSCYAYGGCAYLGICSKTETVEEYILRVNRFNKGIEYKENNVSLLAQMTGKAPAPKPVETQAPTNQPAPVEVTQTAPVAPPSNGTEGVKQKLAALAGVVPGATAPPKAAEPPKAAPSPAPVQSPPASGLKPVGAILPAAAAPPPAVAPQVFESPMAPWANAECKACEGTGISSKGAPCVPCVQVSREGGGAVPEQYDIAMVDGVLTYTPKAVKMESQPLSPPPAQRGRPKEGFRLCINCIPTRTAKKLLRLEDVYAQFAQQLADASNAKNFFELDAFARRDAMAGVAKSVADFIGSQTVTCFARSPDMDHFLLALSPLAQEVYEGK